MSPRSPLARLRLRAQRRDRARSCRARRSPEAERQWFAFKHHPSERPQCPKFRGAGDPSPVRSHRYLNGAAAGVEADTAVGEVNEAAVVDVEQRRCLAELGYSPAQLQGFRERKIMALTGSGG